MQNHEPQTDRQRAQNDTRPITDERLIVKCDECELTVVIPVYNEEATIRQVIESVRETLLASEHSFEVIVLDDGSVDGTPVELEAFDGAPWLKVFRHGENLGKGAAIRTALEAAIGAVIVIQDADLEYDPKEIPRLAEPILKGQADVVFGSRFHDPMTKLGTWRHRSANRLLTWCSRMMHGLPMTDMETGHKAFRRELLTDLEIKEDGFGVEPELTAKLASRAIRFHEIPVPYAPRTWREGKKIRFCDAVWALWCIWRYRRTQVANNPGLKTNSSCRQDEIVV